MTAEGGDLPDDTLLSVRYGGSSTDEYSLHRAPGLQKVLFCDPAMRDGGLVIEPETGDDTALDDAEVDASLAVDDDAASDSAADGKAMSSNPDAGDAAANADHVSPPSDQVEALRCELWTQGAATITVQATGYQTIEQPLKARAKDCRIQTVEVSLELVAEDAGS